MKKVNHTFLLLLVVVSSVLSCKKSDSTTTSPTTGTVVGFWAGSGTTTGTTTSQPVSIVFKSDSKMRLYVGSVSASDTAAITAVNKSDGSYTVLGTNVTCSYNASGVALLLAATANSAFTTMTGTAGISPATSGVGSFTFTKP